MRPINGQEAVVGVYRKPIARPIEIYGGLSVKISREQVESSLKYLRESPGPRNPLRAVPEISLDDIRRVEELLEDTDEARISMVEELRRELDSDTYEVPSDAVAEKLVGRLLSDRVR